MSYFARQLWRARAIGLRTPFDWWARHAQGFQSRVADKLTEEHVAERLRRVRPDIFE